jgi:dimethylargininase
MTLAITKAPAHSLVNCELTYLDREPIQYERAVQQHQAYCATLRLCGLEVVTLPADEAFPDSVFVEDTAIVLDEMAVMTSPGAVSRRGEVEAMAAELAQYRPVEHIHLPATLEGGDVLRIGKTLYVGHSPRTNAAGIERLRELAAPYGYRVVAVRVTGCLHLKTGCTVLDDETLLVHPGWIDLTEFAGFRVLEIHPEEPFAANVMRLGGTIVMNSASPATVEKVERQGYTVLDVDISEFMKAEAGLTCMSLIVE